MKYQCGNVWIRNKGHFELDFEFISWILKWSRNGPSTLHNYLQIVITSSFQIWFAHYLKSWILDFHGFEKIYSLPKMDFRKLSKFHFKFILHVATRFYVPNFHSIWWICSMPHYPCSLAFHHSPWVLTHPFPYLNPFLIFQNLKWFNLHIFFP